MVENMSLMWIRVTNHHRFFSYLSRKNTVPDDISQRQSFLSQRRTHTHTQGNAHINTQMIIWAQLRLLWLQSQSLANRWLKKHHSNAQPLHVIYSVSVYIDSNLLRQDLYFTEIETNQSINQQNIMNYL